MSQPSIPLPDATDILSLRTALDAASNEQRLAWLGGLSGRQIVALYDLAEGQRLEVSAMHRGEGEVVIHEGMNSMLMFRSFQKRMVIQDGEVSGYNHQFWAWLTGAGSFSLRASPDVDGELHIDYINLPRQGHPEFPPVVDNTKGLSALAYGNMIDVLRRVSDHVTVGKAYLKGEPRGQFFALCRREEA
jgi:hypothetical protein